MIIQRKIKVKVIVTENFKNVVVNEMQETIKKIEAEIAFIEQRTKKTVTELTIKASPQVNTVREQLEYERRKREETKSNLLEQIKQVNALEEGSEVLQGEVEGPAEVSVGADWKELYSKEIVVKDGIVVEIR